MLGDIREESMSNLRLITHWRAKGKSSWWCYSHPRASIIKTIQASPGILTISIAPRRDQVLSDEETMLILASLGMDMDKEIERSKLSGFLKEHSEDPIAYYRQDILNNPEL